MKKIISLILAVLMFVSVIPMTASAGAGYLDKFDGTFYYTVSAGEKWITDVVDTVKHAVIPEGYYGILGNAFYQNENLLTVSFPKSLRRIESYAFSRCPNLMAVSFNHDATLKLSLESYAFYYCDNIYSVYLSSNVTADAKAFYGCEGSVNPNFNNLFIYFDVNEYSADHVHQMRWLTIDKAHCRSEGFLVYGCTCGYIEDYEETWYDRDVHTSVKTYEAVDPTCTQDGHTEEKYCRNCDTYFQRAEIIPRIGHSMSDVPKVFPAKCIADGYAEYSCTRKGCSYKETEIIKAPGSHIDNDHDGYCDRDNCGYDFTEYCSHICHKDGISGFFYKIALVFWKLFKTNKECACGMYHY